MFNVILRDEREGYVCTNPKIVIRTFENFPSMGDVEDYFNVKLCTYEYEKFKNEWEWGEIYMDNAKVYFTVKKLALIKN